MSDGRIRTSSRDGFVGYVQAMRLPQPQVGAGAMVPLLSGAFPILRSQKGAGIRYADLLRGGFDEEQSGGDQWMLVKPGLTGDLEYAARRGIPREARYQVGRIKYVVENARDLPSLAVKLRHHDTNRC